MWLTAAYDEGVWQHQAAVVGDTEVGPADCFAIDLCAGGPCLRTWIQVALHAQG